MFVVLVYVVSSCLLLGTHGNGADSNNTLQSGNTTFDGWIKDGAVDLGQLFTGFMRELRSILNSTQPLTKVPLYSLLKLDYVQLLKQVVYASDLEKIIPRNNNTTPLCYSHSLSFIEALIGSPTANSSTLVSEEWAMQMVDSYGKLMAGMFEGRLQLYGDYHECLASRSRSQLPELQFKGQYCRVQIPLEDLIQIKFPEETNSYWKNTHVFDITLNWGICVPDSCTEEDVMLVLSEGLLGRLIPPVSRAICSGDEASLGNDAPAIVAVCILALITCIVLSCTVCDVYVQRKADKKAKFLAENQEIIKKPIDPYKKERHYFVNGKRIDEIIIEEERSVIKPKLENKSNKMDHHVEMKEIDLGTDNLLEKSTNNKNGSVNKQITNDEEICNSSFAAMEHSTSVSNTLEAGVDNSKGKQKRKHESATAQLMHGFSIYSNMPKLLRTVTSQDMITCLSGIKVFSICWVILGHTFTFGAILDRSNIMFSNPAMIPRLIAQWTFHIVTSGNLSVDTFFTISGFLVMKNSLQELQRIGPKVSFWVYFVLHRFWRLMPIYMIVLMIVTTLYDHIVTGPLKADGFKEFEDCKDKWWSHLLFINNFYKPNKKCMSWTWFLAVDVQLHCLSSIFIYLCHRKLKIGIITLLTVIPLGIIASFVSEYHYTGYFINMDLVHHDYWAYVYTVPWTRLGPFFVGLLLGVLLYKKPKEPIVSEKIAWVIWLCVTTLALFLVFIPHDGWKENADQWSYEAYAFYESLSRPLWGLCIAWVVYSCHMGLGGIINSILSWPAFIPLSRLTYTVYLIHPMVITFTLYSRQAPIFLDDGNISIAYAYIGYVVLTHLLAVPFSLFFESPLITMEKVAMGKH